MIELTSLMKVHIQRLDLGRKQGLHEADQTGETYVLCMNQHIHGHNESVNSICNTS